MTKSCLLEDRVSAHGDCVVVPWGATFAQVKEGLKLALRADHLARQCAVLAGGDTPIARGHAPGPHGPEPPDCPARGSVTSVLTF